MRNFLMVVGIMLLSGNAYGQQEKLVEGSVSFLTTRNVYVKFSSTGDIATGDTLYQKGAPALIPVLLVENKSSISTVCRPIGTTSLQVGDQIVARFITKKSENNQKERPIVVEQRDILLPNNDPIIKPEEDNNLEEVRFKEKIKGRLSAASYSSLSDFRNDHRMRYAFSFRGHHLNDTRWSVDSYVTFRHQLKDSINFADALKVYAFSLRYDLDQNASITFGRKINPKFSSMGAIDGLQFEKGLGNLSVGLIAGSRPDLGNYGLNLNLLQYGGYASIASNKPGKFSESTLGFIQQMNRGNTDRRFVYFQHSSNLLKDLNLFSSFEVDLFQNINEQVDSSPRLTNIYASLRYRFNKKLRFSLAYDNRRNIIYYETYKNFIDQFIEDETRQGLRAGFHHRPFKNVSWGANTSLRFQTSQKNPSRNLNGFITVTKVPYLNARVSLRANFLQTDILDSQIFGVRMARGFAKNKVRGEVYYRYVDYQYKIGERVLHQDIFGASVSMNIQRKLTLHLFYEGVFDSNSQLYHRFNTRIIKRF